MVTIITYDMRKGRVKDLEKSTLRWYPALCDTIYKSLLSFAIADGLPYGQERLPTGVSKSGGLPRQSREEVAIASGWRGCRNGRVLRFRSAITTGALQQACCGSSAAQGWEISSRVSCANPEDRV